MDFVHVELKRDSWIQPKMNILNPNDAISCVEKMIKDMDREILVSINLASDGSVINASICSIGTVNQALVSVSEIIRTTILSGAARIILIHNHPSGSSRISKEDKECTRKMALACSLLDLELLDHLVIGRDGYVSIKNENAECFCIRKNEYEKLIAEGEYDEK